MDWSQLSRWIDTRPVELLGASVLLACATAGLVVVWSQQPAPPVAGESPAVTSDIWDADTGLQQPTSLTVHVAGAVHTPTVVNLAVGARVVDALDAAGGPTVDAYLDHVNLARVLADGEQVYVPTFDESTHTSSADGRIDINRADEAALITLPGIGPSRAQAIIDHRHRHGPFQSTNELGQIRGIGPATLEQLSELIVVR